MNMYDRQDGDYRRLAGWGARLRAALGPDVLDRNTTIGGEFRPPTYRSCIEALDRQMWEAHDGDWRSVRVIPYNREYDGLNGTAYPHGRHGFMANTVNSYEFAYAAWDHYKNYSPNLLDDGTFGVWLSLLPQPVSLIFGSRSCTLRWCSTEPRVNRSPEMGRYTLPESECEVTVSAMSPTDTWKHLRAEAYIQAWEKMIRVGEPNGYFGQIEPQSYLANPPRATISLAKPGLRVVAGFLDQTINTGDLVVDSIVCRLLAFGMCGKGTEVQFMESCLKLADTLDRSENFVFKDLEADCRRPEVIEAFTRVVKHPPTEELYRLAMPSLKRCGCSFIKE